MAKAISQYTIRDENDISIGTTAPTGSVKDQMWLDTSKNPSVLKRYNGSSWDVVNDYSGVIEDVEEKIQANTTAITVAQGQISGLISESSIIKGDVTTIKNNYTSVKATVDGINTTVASHTTSITNLGTNVTNAQNTANNANTLADSKAKVFTSTPTTPYKIGDIWTGGPSGEIMKCKVARATGSYVAADWEKASKYTDDTKANAVEVNLNNLSGKVTTVETKQATLEQNIEGFKTTVSSTYSTKTELSTVDGKVSSLTSRVSTVESSITQLNNKIALKVEATEVNSIVNNAVDDIEVGGRNYIKGGKGDVKTGFFSNFNIVENGYGEHTLTSKKNYSSVVITEGFILGCRDYKVGKQVTMSYEIMYTKWDFPVGSTRSEFWIGQRYTGGTPTSSEGAWRGVTQHTLPIVGQSGCELNQWYRVERTLTIPEQAHESIGSTGSIQFYNSNADVSASVTFRIRNVKLEYGNKATDWTPSQEDTDQSIQAVDSKVETVKNNVSQLTVDLTSITGRVSSTESTISSHTTQLGTVDTRINTAKTSAINTASTDATTKANNAKSGAVSDAKSYTDGQITTVNSTINTKVAEIKATTDSITSRVSSTESSITTINGSVSGLTTRVNSVEQNITATAITTTISSAINAGTSSISTTQFVMDKNGLAIKNGALTIKNKAGATVLTADTDGNLFVQNTLAVGGNTNGNIQVKNASNANIFTVSKNGVFLKDGTMRVTSGNVNWDGITYPSGGTKEMIVYSNGISINQLDYSGSQEYIHNGYYYSDGLRLVEDNRRNADGRYLETIINARGISTLSLILSAYSQDNTGYTPLPNGFILQWGNNAGLQSGWGTNFKIGFPNVCLAVIPICTTHQIAIKVASKTKNNFVIDVGTTTGVGLNYLAIGY
ncbi:hypothetical protein A500_16330 [Clostridium sartagoforme AAU1]|uniref:Putative tail fiber protein gp53-like C-terminal domain-containing protein n=1 Tax=Clostridium sartagoforme AAU1 TaxID=1202534 RepID=R9BV31_9CLOT|nr:hypothetical protein [Clostridium sartagoforme]EOR20575.1 hypothetical protein A500_16330 [Clostridium sartagoforme AAU1]